MVKTNLGSLNLQSTDDLPFWDKYFAGPSEHESYRSVVDHPATHLTPKDLAEKHYDLTAVNELNTIGQKDPRSADTPGRHHCADCKRILVA